MATIGIIGTGYVGLVTGAVMAEKGHRVVCCDIDEAKIAALEAGRVPFFEPGLPQMLDRVRAAGRLSFTTSVPETVAQAEFVFLAVGTPPHPDTGEADLSAVMAAAAQIGAALTDYRIIVVKSTVPVGTARKVAQVIAENRRHDADFDVLSNPEFLREGAAVEDARRPVRIVIGAAHRDPAMRLMEIFAPFEAPIIITSLEAAEMCKYACNVFLAMKLSFTNLLAMLCEKVGADITEVTKAMGYDQRIGPHFLGAGLGFGGSCLPKDTLALLNTLRSHALPTGMVEDALRVNEAMAGVLVDKIRRRLGDLAGRTLALWGLAFKPNTDDMRQASSVRLVSLLRQAGVAQIKAHDPQAMDNARRLMPDLIYCADPYEACDGAHAAVLVTQWPEYEHLDLRRVAALLGEKVIFDGRNFLDPQACEVAGLEYHGLGRY